MTQIFSQLPFNKTGKWPACCENQECYRSGFERQGYRQRARTRFREIDMPCTEQCKLLKIGRSSKTSRCRRLCKKKASWISLHPQNLPTVVTIAKTSAQATVLLSRNSEEGRKNDAGTNLSASISQVPYQKKKKAYQMKTWGITIDSRYSTESNQAKGHRGKKKQYSQCCCLTWQVWWNVSAEKIFFEVPYRRRTLANPLWHTREGHEKNM